MYNKIKKKKVFANDHLKFVGQYKHICIYKCGDLFVYKNVHVAVNLLQKKCFFLFFNFNSPTEWGIIKHTPDIKLLDDINASYNIMTCKERYYNNIYIQRRIKF